MLEKLRHSFVITSLPQPAVQRRGPFLRAVVVAAALLLACWFVLVGVRALDASDFMLIAWDPGQDLLSGRGVEPGYPYPLWTVVLLLPFVVWSPPTAMLLWLIANVLMLAASICLLLRLFDAALSLPLLALVVPLVAYFLPTITSVWLGQLTVFSLLMLVAAVYALRQASWWWVGAWLGFSLIKPQVTILVTGFVLVWALWVRRWQIIAGFVLIVALLTAISLPFIAAPRQLIGGGIGEHLSGYLAETSTLWALCLALGSPLLVPAVLSAALLGWIAWKWLPVLRSAQVSDRFNYLIALTMIVNLVVVPYSWLHNLLLLLFPLAYGFARAWQLAPGRRLLWFLVLLGVMHPFFLLVYFGLSMPLDLQTYQVIPALALLPLLVLVQRQACRPETVRRGTLSGC